MKPYYDEDGITIYHGDCREIEAWLAADLLLTDPPYGRAWRQRDTRSVYGWASDRNEGIANDADPTVRDAALAMWGERPAIVFGDLTLAPPCGTKATLVYDKGNDAGFTGAIGGDRRNVEGVYLLGPHGSSLGGRSGAVADPFMGSGSTLVAAKLLGRRSVGVELEERWCEVAAKRLAQGVLDFGATA